MNINADIVPIKIVKIIYAWFFQIKIYIEIRQNNLKIGLHYKLF